MAIGKNLLIPWKDVKSLDDCIQPEEKKIITLLRKRKLFNNTCEYLKKEGNFFYFCAKNLNKEDTDNKEINPTNKKYLSHTGIIEMQIFCIGNYENCCVYQRK